MDFYSMYSNKATDKKEQQEDYLTELVAFMCNISGEFKELYFKDFLGLKIKKCEMYETLTQNRIGDKEADIPDLLIRNINSEEEDYYCVCEHKIDSIKGFEKQLEKYSYYNEKNNKFIVPKKYPVSKEYLKTIKGNWDLLYWEQLFEIVFTKYNTSELANVFEYENINDYVKKNPKTTLYDRLIFTFLDYMQLSNLYDLKYSYPKNKYLNCFDMLRNIRYVNHFNAYRSILKKLSDGEGSRAGCEIKNFIEEHFIYMKSKKTNDYIGIYWWIDQNKSRFLSWNGDDHESIDFNKIREVLKIEKSKFDFLNFDNTDKFNEEFDNAHEGLQHVHDFIKKIIEVSSKLLYKKSAQMIRIKSFKSTSDYLQYSIECYTEDSNSKSNIKFCLNIKQDSFEFENNPISTKILESNLDNGINKIAEFVFNKIKA